MADQRRQHLGSPYYTKLIFVICAVTVVTRAVTAAATVVVEERMDVMGSYSLSNREQCQRLCWYRTLCSHYSYNTEVASAGVNCLLHAQPLQGQFQTLLLLLLLLPPPLLPLHFVLR